MKNHPATRLLFASTLLGTFALIPATYADLVAYDAMDYALGTVDADPDGGINSTQGLAYPAGRGLRSNYGTDTTVVAGLSYTNAGGTLSTLGNGMRRSAGTGFSVGSANLYRYGGPGIYSPSDPYLNYRSSASANWFGWNGSYATELYYSVLLNWNAIGTGTDNRLVVKLGINNSQMNTYLSQNGANWGFGDQFGSGFTFAPAVANETVFIVCRVGFPNATSMVTDYWFNPVLGQPLGDPSYSKTYTTTPGPSFAPITSGGQFQGIQTRESANIMTFDEFRLGTTATSVMRMAGVVAPTAPSTFVATANSFDQVGLTWADNSNEEIDFFIERSPTGTEDWRQIAVVPANTTSYTDSGLSAVTTYYYRLRAANGGGDSAVASANVTTPSSAVITPPPTEMAGVADSFSEITLTWVENAPDEISVVLQRSPDGTTEWTTIATLAPDSATYQDISLVAATTYHYRTYAVAPGGNSVPSNVASITTLALPPAVALDPVVLPFADPDSTSLMLAAPVTGFTGYSGQGSITTAAALTYPGVTSSGNGLQTIQNQRGYFTIDTNLQGLAHYVSGGQIGGSGLGVLYVRWLARGISGLSSDTVDFRTAANDSSNVTRASIGTTADNAFIRAMCSTTATTGINKYVTSALTPSAGTDLYVARFTFASTGVTILDLFVNKTTESTPDATITGAIVFNTIGYSKFNAGAPPALDEFRIGTSYAAVVDAATGGNFASWASTNGVTGGLQGDSDTDGVTNVMEYALQSNLTGSDGSLGTFNGGLMTFNKRQAAIDNSDVTYIIETSPNLQPPWTPQVTHDVDNVDTSISYPLPTGAGKVFGRLRILVTE